MSHAIHFHIVFIFVSSFSVPRTVFSTNMHRDSNFSVAKKSFQTHRSIAFTRWNLFTNRVDFVYWTFRTWFIWMESARKFMWFENSRVALSETNTLRRMTEIISAQKIFNTFYKYKFLCDLFLLSSGAWNIEICRWISKADYFFDIDKN